MVQEETCLLTRSSLEVLEEYLNTLIRLQEHLDDLITEWPNSIWTTDIELAFNRLDNALQKAAKATKTALGADEEVNANA